jgi:hypothetical protein
MLAKTLSLPVLPKILKSEVQIHVNGNEEHQAGLPCLQT